MQPLLAQDPEAHGLFAPRPPKVLLVEADESARSVLSVTLKAAGLEVLEADTGALALKTLRQSDVSLAIVSSDLNGEDGFSVVALMRGEGRHRLMPVVLLAKGGEAQVRELSKVVDADELLLKPTFAKEVAALAVMQLAERSLDGTVKVDASKAPPNQLLRGLLSGERSGVFELCGGRAHIAFRAGAVIDAQVDRHHGPDALVKALALHVGTYRVAFRPVQFAPAFQLSLREVLHRIEPRLRAFAELAQQSAGLETRLGIEFAALARALPSLPDAANTIVKLFDGVRTVRQVVLDSPHDELLTLQVTQKLIALGIIKPAEEPAAVESVPELFGPRPDDADRQMSELFSAVPLQMAADAGGEKTDWSDVLIRGEQDADPSAGWVAGALAPELVKQLEAFDIRQVEEPQAPAPAPEPLSPAMQELKDFAQPIPLTEAVAPRVEPELATPIEAASIDALESGFFEHPSRSTVIPEVVPEVKPTAPSARAGTSTSQVLAGVVPAAAPDSRRGGLMLVAAVLLAVTVAIVAAMFAQDRQAPPPAPKLDVAPAPAVKPVPQPSQVAPVARPETAEELKDATALYEAGKVKEAVAALEQTCRGRPLVGAGLADARPGPLRLGRLAGRHRGGQHRARARPRQRPRPPAAGDDPDRREQPRGGERRDPEVPRRRPERRVRQRGARAAQTLSARRR